MQRYPGSNHNEVREQGDSIVYTIPKDLARELELEPGESPSDIEWDDEQRQISLSF